MENKTKNQFIEAKIAEFEELIELGFKIKHPRIKSFLSQSLSEMSNETLSAVEVGKKSVHKTEPIGYPELRTRENYNEALAEVEQKKKEWNG